MTDRRRRSALVERQMRIIDADALERSDDAIELRDVRHGTDAHSIHAAARDLSSRTNTLP